MSRNKNRQKNRQTAFDGKAPSYIGTGSGISVPVSGPPPEDAFLLLAPQKAVGAYSGYEAANSSPIRGYLWNPTTNPRTELSEMSDREIRRRIGWLWKNFPFCRRMCKGPAKLLGIQTPQPVTSDDNWNELVFDDFAANAGNPMYFDRRARFDFFSVQPVRNTLRYRDGRVLGVMTETVTGGAQMAYYEADQIQNPADNARGFEHGILTDEADRPLAYSVRDGKDSSKYYEIPARDAIYYGNFEGFGSLIGESMLIPMVTGLTDIVELRGLRMQGAKSVADIGLVIESDRPMRVTSGGIPGLAGPVYTTEVSTPDGTKKQKVSWELLTASGVIPKLEEGQKIRVVSDDRPSPNTQAFEAAIIESLILGEDLPPAALYFIAGRGMPGPAVRFNMEEIERWISIRHRQQAFENRRYWAVYVAKRINQFRESRGRFGIPPHPTGAPWWRQVDMIGQPIMTIDRGRNDAATVVRLESGLTTWTNEYAKEGLYARRELREKIRETAYVKAQVALAAVEHKVELTLGECIPRLAGAAAKDDPVFGAELNRQTGGDSEGFEGNGNE